MRELDAQRKADLLKELAHKEGLRLEQTIAVGDGANDLPMLAIAGLGVAFRAKPLVKQSAKQAISTLGLDGVLTCIYGDACAATTSIVAEGTESTAASTGAGEGVC